MVERLGVCVANLGGIRKAVHPSQSKSRRLLGERQKSADKHDAQNTSTMRKRVSFQAHSLARRACRGTNIHLPLALLLQSRQQPVHSMSPRIEIHTQRLANKLIGGQPMTAIHRQ